MSYWLYIQAVFNLVLVGTSIYLWVGYRRVRSQGEWRKELVPLVETLGELLIEIERLSARGRVTGESESPSKAPTTMTIAPAGPTEALSPASMTAAPKSDGVKADQPSTVAPSPVEPVLALAEQGVPAEEIARRLGRPIGEVSLVLGLRTSGVALTA